MRHKIFLICLSFFLWAHGQVSDAKTDLLQAYSDAVKNDPTFQTQVANYLATEQEIPIARSTFYPQVDVSGELSETRQTTTFNGANRFNSNDYGLTLSQAIFNITTFKEFSRAKLSVRAAAAQLKADQQALMIRLVRAYLLVLQAQDFSRYVKQQKRFLHRQWSAVKERYDLGQATIIALDQARGSYVFMQAEQESAEVSLENRIQELGQITGVDHDAFATLHVAFKVVTPDPADLEMWVDLAKKQNAALQAVTLRMQAARKSIQVAAGNYWPTIEAVANWNNLNNLGTPRGFSLLAQQKTRTKSIGLNLTWSLFEGGLTRAQVKQAMAQYQAASANRDNTYLAVLAETRKAYQGMLRGFTRVQQGRVALQNNTSALKYSEEGFRAGTQTITEVLQIQTRLFESQRKYVDNLYTYLLDAFLLKQAAGALTLEDMDSLNGWLVAQDSRNAR